MLESKIENGNLTLFFKGRIDSSVAPALEAEAEAKRTEIPHESLTVDAEALEYISSAGLRIVLRLRKAEPSLKVIGASSEVYDIFEMTGFTEMIPVEKAYRKISVDGCEVIGVGANGKVYRVDPDTVVKVYYNKDALPDIHRERKLAHRAFVLGIPTAISYDVVKVGDSYGSMFELLNAKSLAKLIADDLDHLEKYADIFVDLLKKIHTTEVEEGDMPEMRDVAIGWAEFVKDYLPPEKGEKLVSLVKAVKPDLRMIHGDYHPKNIMVQNGEILLIDMDTLCHGNPVFEFGSVYNACVAFSELDPSISMQFQGFPREYLVKLWELTLRGYFGTDDGEVLAKEEKKAQLVGYMRLFRRTVRRGGFDTEEGKRTLELYKSRLLTLIDEVDDLSY